MNSPRSYAGILLLTPDLWQPFLNIHPMLPASITGAEGFGSQLRSWVEQHVSAILRHNPRIFPKSHVQPLPCLRIDCVTREPSHARARHEITFERITAFRHRKPCLSTERCRRKFIFCNVPEPPVSSCAKVGLGCISSTGQRVQTALSELNTILTLDVAPG